MSIQYVHSNLYSHKNKAQEAYFLSFIYLLFCIFSWHIYVNSCLKDYLKPVIINLKNENEFRLTAKELEDAITEKTKLLILPFPNNPTGAIMEREDLEAIREVIIKHDIYVLSDEIYAELTYKGDHVSIASLPGMRERTILINGFSKAYAMTGWRLGYACGPANIIAQMTKIHQFAIMCAPTTSQYAAVEALKNGDEDVRSMCEAYNQRRRFLMSEFEKMGLVSPVIGLNNIRFKRPSTVGDTIDIEVSVKAYNSIILTMHYVMKVKDTVILEGDSDHCFLTKEGKMLPLGEKKFPELDKKLKELLPQ